MSSFWTDERVETLKKLWEAGLSCSEIAAEMKGGLTRNAVIGKIHRLGLSNRVVVKKVRIERVKPTSRHNRATRFALSFNAATITQIPIEPFEERLAKVQPLHINLMQLTNATCKYPYGKNAPFTFCGCTVQAEKPYCPEHVELCSARPNPAETSRRRSASMKDAWKRRKAEEMAA